MGLEILDLQLKRIVFPGFVAERHSRLGGVPKTMGVLQTMGVPPLLRAAAPLTKKGVHRMKTSLQRLKL